MEDVEADQGGLADDRAAEQELAHDSPTSGTAAAILVPTVIAQKASWSQGSR